MREIFFFSVLMAQCLMFNVECFAQDKIIAIVNKDIITQKDLDDFTNFMRMQISQDSGQEHLEERIEQIKPGLIDRLVEDRLILYEAKKILQEAKDKKNLMLVRYLEPDRGKIDERLSQMRKQYDSDLQFQSALSAQGFNVADIRTRLEDQILMRNIIEYKIKSSIAVNPSEVTDFYNANRQEFYTAQERMVSVIVVDKLKQVNEIFLKLKDPRQWDKVISDYKLKTDKLSVFKDQDLREDINAAVFSLQAGQISKPLKAGDKYYIFRLDSINESRPQTLQEVQDKISAYLSNLKTQSKMADWLKELRSKAYIKITDLG